jgi:hypothetical protein
MSRKWTLTEGVQKLFSNNADGEPEIDDLSTEERRLTLDVSFAVVEVDEYNSVKIAPTKGISVILSGFPPNDGKEHDEDIWMFSRVILPDDGETLPELVQRIALGLGIQSNERIWEDGQS